jgi:hypothetical protein
LTFPSKIHWTSEKKPPNGAIKRRNPTQISAGWYYEVRLCEVESRGMSYGSVGGLGIGVTKQSASQSSGIFSGICFWLMICFWIFCGTFLESGVFVIWL